MTFFNPAGFILLAALPVIVLLHLFRQERRRQEVSSLFLWKEISDQHSRRIRPQLLRNINLLLQLLAVIAASLALAGPTLVGAGRAGAPRLIVLVDTSAGMAATDGQVSRIDLARNRAREVVGRSRRDTEVMVATSGPVPSVRQGFTTDRSVVYEVIRTLEVQDGPGNLDAAAEMIRGLGNTQDTDIVLITDAAFTLDELVVLPPRFRTERVGEAAANRGIAAFQLRRRFDGSALEAYLEICNFAPQTASLLVEISVDGRAISRREIEVAAGETRRLAISLPGVTGSVYQAVLLDNQDALATDDIAHAVASAVRPLRVQLVTAGNYFLESILSVYPNVSLTVTPTVIQSQPADLYVLDGVDAPVGLVGSVLSVATAMADGPFAATEMVPVSRQITLNPSHPISRNLDLSSVTITRAMGGVLSGRALSVATAGDVPLIYTSVHEHLRLVGLTFSLADSDIGLRSDFPVLISNIISWLAPSPQLRGLDSSEAGEAVQLLVTPGSPFIITTPSGDQAEYIRRGNTLLYTDTMEAGLYTVAGVDFADAFAVSLTDAGESNLEPRLAPDGETEGAPLVTERAPGRPVWHLFAALALLLMAADWIIWARRT